MKTYQIKHIPVANMWVVTEITEVNGVRYFRDVEFAESKGDAEWWVEETKAFAAGQ